LEGERLPGLVSLRLAGDLHPVLSHHRQAVLRAGSARGDTPVHAADPLAVGGAFGANLGALATDVPVMGGIDQHEVRGGPAYLGASHHQPEMRGLDMLPTGLETVVHRGAQAGFITAQAALDATVHILGNHHGVALVSVHLGDS